MRHRNLQTVGFSLVELSIVLVILGLLTGGILAGQSLIRAAELRSVSTEYQRYTSAINSFRDKYFQLPGDMSNATKFWNTTPVCPGDFSNPSTDQRTCDGNGDGQVHNSWTEVWRAWQHMANAGLVEGSYTGVHGASGLSYVEAGKNAPLSRAGNNASWALIYRSSIAVGNINYFAVPAGNVLFFGTNSDVDDPVITATEAWNLDTKMDDGRPGLGKILGYKNSIRPNCVSAGTESTAEYLLTDTTRGCNLTILIGS